MRNDGVGAASLRALSEAVHLGGRGCCSCRWIASALHRPDVLPGFVMPRNDACRGCRAYFGGDRMSEALHIPVLKNEMLAAVAAKAVRW